MFIELVYPTHERELDLFQIWANKVHSINMELIADKQEALQMSKADETTIETQL